MNRDADPLWIGRRLAPFLRRAAQPQSVYWTRIPEVRELAAGEARFVWRRDPNPGARSRHWILETEGRDPVPVYDIRFYGAIGRWLDRHREATGKREIRFSELGLAE